MVALSEAIKTVEHRLVRLVNEAVKYKFGVDAGNRVIHPDLRRTAVQYESFRLTPDMQTRAENETAGYVRPGVENGSQSASAGQLQPSTPTLHSILQIQSLQMITTRARTTA